MAEEQHRVVGFVSVRIQDEQHSLLQPLRMAYVGIVGVSIDHRGRDIGKALMHRAEQRARSREAEELRLIVWAFNMVALRLYEELGYELRSHQLAKPLGAATSGE